MASELQHIDDFFRKKNEDALADLSSVDLHWQQMRTTLNSGLSLPAKKPNTSFVKQWMKYAAAATIVSSLLFISITKPWKGTTHKEASTKANISIPATIKPTIQSKQATKGREKEKESGKRVQAPVTPVPAMAYSIDTNSLHNNMEAATAAAFSNFYNELKKQPEQFVINAGRDTTIHCKEGSSLFIPASCFQSLTGTAINSTVEVYVQEFYNFSDIIGNKLTTLSNGQTLVTGGMLNIKAAIQDQELMMRPGTAMKLTMPTRNFDPNMQLFTTTGINATERSIKFDEPSMQGVRGDTVSPVISRENAQFNNGINWLETGQTQFFRNETRKYITILNLTDNPYEVVYRGDRAIGKFRIPYDCKYSTEEIKQELVKRYGRYYDKIKVKRQWKPLFKKEKDPRTGAIGSWDLTMMVGDSITIPLWIARLRGAITKDDSLAYEAKWRQEYEDAVKNQRSYSEFIQVRENYNFTISNLGWINCDRFSNYPPSRLAEFTITTSDEFKGAYFQAMLILESQHSALPGHWGNGTISFSRLPAGEVVNVICVGAKNGKVFSAIKQFIVSKGQENTLQFSETTPAEFRNALAYLGNVTFPQMPGK